jgi:hypothetical protein
MGDQTVQAERGLEMQFADEALCGFLSLPIRQREIPLPF